MNLKSEPTRKRFAIVDLAHPMEFAGRQCAFGLVDASDTILRVDETPRRLADYAFEMLDADEVAHDESLIPERY